MRPLLFILRRLACFMCGVCRTDRGRTGKVGPTKERHRDSGRNGSRLNIVGLINRMSRLATSPEQRQITKERRTEG